MENAKYQYSEVRVEAIEGKFEGPALWPFLASLAIPGGLLVWEALSPLPEVPASAVGFAALGLVFLGIALWVIFFVKA